MKGGYIALLDVLGFASLVASDASGARLDSYLECLQSVRRKKKAGTDVEYVVFSDSIVLSTPDDSPNSFLALANQCSVLLGAMLEKDIPLRGAIACGSYFRTQTTGGVFLAGKAIIDAYNFEKAQDWVGIMLAPSAILRAGDLTKIPRFPQGGSHPAFETFLPKIELVSQIQPCASIPFHVSQLFEDNNYEGFAIVPTDGSSDARSVSDSIGQSVGALRRMKALAPNPAAQAKYKRAISWLEPLQREWGDVAYWIERWKEEAKQANS